MDRKRHHRHHRLHLWTKAQQYLSSFFRILSLGPIISLLFGVAFLPVLYMGGEAWWLPLELIVALVGFFCWILSYWWRGYRAGHIRLSLTILFFVLPLAVAFLQCIPCARLTSLLSPKGFNLIEEFNALGIVVAKHSISLSPERTYRYILLLFVALLFHLLALSHCSERMKMRLMLLGIVFAAVGNAVLAFYEFIANGTKSGLNLPVFSGAFLNTNHFGFLMMLGIMSDLALLMGIVLDDKHAHRRRNSMTSGEEYEWKGWRVLIIPLGLVLFVLFTALLMSFSRGAFLGTVASLIVFGIIWLLKRHEVKKANLQVLLPIIILVVVSVIGAMPFVMDALSKHFSNALEGELTMNSRWLIWKDSIKLISDYRLSGVGLGCFKNAIQPYESGNFTKALVEHAHNDYLELIAELGVPVAIVLMLGLVVFLSIVFHRCWKVHDPTYKWTCFGLLSAMVGIAVHELFDFNLHAYPNFLIFAVMLSLLAICIHKKGKSMEEITGMSHSELHELNRKKRFGFRLVLLPLAFLLMVATLPHCIRKFRAAVLINKLRMDESLMGRWTVRPGDYSRRIALSKAILARYPNNVRTLMYKATSEAGLALHPSIKREQAVKLITEASEDMSFACSCAPGDGDAALLCAWVFALSNNMLVRTDTLEQQLKLYDWAYKCYPRIVGTVDAVATFACQAYILSYYTEPEHKEEFKSYALAKSMELIDLRPKSFSKIYALLPILVDGYDKLLEVAPDSIPARKELMDYLVEKQEYDIAIDVIESFLVRLNSEQMMSDFELANYRLYALALMNFIYELKNDGDKRAENWPRMLDAVAKCESLRETAKPIRKGEKREFRVRYREFTPEYYYDKALNAKQMGRINDVVHFLLPITYTLEKGNSIDVYRKSLELLSGWETYFDESIEARAKFLENALSILAIEAGAGGNPKKSIDELEALEKKVVRQNNAQWLQRHLIPLYIARGNELIGDKAEALAAYRRCLDICALNYIALCGIERCTDNLDEALTEEELRVFGIIRSRKTPIAYLRNGLVWQAMETTPKVVDKMQGAVNSEFMFICRRDTRESINCPMEYYDKRGSAFIVKISFSPDEALLWRIGQIILVNKTIQPYSNTLRKSHRIIAPGDIMVHSRISSMPNTLLKAFEYSNKSDNNAK